MQETEEINTCYSCGKDKETGFIFKDIDDEDEGVYLCKDCIDAIYPREKEIKIEYVEIPKETIKVLGFSEPIL